MTLLEQLHPQLVPEGYLIGRQSRQPATLWGMSRRLLSLIGVVVVVAFVTIGLIQSLGQHDNRAPQAGRFDLAAAQRTLAGAPEPLAALHAQANALLPASTSTLEQRIKALKGHPIVVNKWASWCGPCRYEFPFLQQASVKFGKRIAFIGLDSGDADDAAAAFLKRFPLTYPSYVDRKARVAQHFGIGQSFPTTMYYDATGKMQYAHQGNYADEQALSADIERYALGRPS
jgi:cytochrome c biogenesis protein CcmG/thiol:disulfide interchange protein DsbE